MKNTKGFTLIEIVIVIVIILILTAIAVPRFMNMNKDEDVVVNIKTAEKFSQDSLYSKENPEMKEVTKVPKEVKKELIFHAKIVGKMSCDGCLGNLKVYEFCYNGVKYFTIYGGYMAPKMKKASNGVVHHETCD